MQPVKITIESHAKGLDEDDCLQTIFFGQMTEREEKFYVVYEETAATGLEGTKTTIKWDMERVVILRHGKLEHRQEFAFGFIDNSLYKTPYMDIPVVVKTKNIAITRDDDSWKLCVEYSTEIGEDVPNEISLKIVIEEENKGEH